MNSLSECQNRKKSYKDLIHYLKNGITRANPADISKEHCPKFFSSFPEFDPLSCMLELINYRNYLMKNNTYPIDELTKKIITNVIHYDNYNPNSCIHLFDKNIELFYTEEPECKPNYNTDLINNMFDLLNKRFDKIDSKFDLINERIDKIDCKLKTMEQFQAQILDKLTVFTEMIDEIQTTIKK